MSTSILVITGEPNWTRRAMHLAAAMARERAEPVLIVHLIPVAHMEYLGAGSREELLSYDAYNALSEYADTAAGYGVRVELVLFESIDYAGAVCSAVEQYDPAAVFAPAPGGPLFARLRLWWLRRSLRRALYTLGPGDPPPALTHETAEADGAEPNPALLPRS